MRHDQRCILIAEDEEKILRALKDFLLSNNFYVLAAADGDKAMKVYYENSAQIDLVLLDIMMPFRDGISVLGEIREHSLVPVIMLTARGEEYDQIKGFRCGADDYIPKPFSPSLLLARIEAVLKRVGKDREKDQDVFYGGIGINIIKRTVKLDGIPIELTPKEFDLLYFLAVNHGLPLTREQILNGVWGYNFIGDVRTVDTHVKQLRGKLSQFSSYIKTIHKIGYQFEVST